MYAHYITVNYPLKGEMADVTVNFSIPMDEIPNGNNILALLMGGSLGDQKAAANRLIVTDAKVAPVADVYDGDERSPDIPEPEAEGISDTQLLNSVASAAERVGPDNVKALVKEFAVGRGRPTVKNIPADKRSEFIGKLKDMMVCEGYGVSGEGEAEVDMRNTTAAKATSGSRRRRG